METRKKKKISKMMMVMQKTKTMKKKRMRLSDPRLSPFSGEMRIFDAVEDTIEIDVELEKKRRWCYRSADDYKDEYHTRWRGGPHRGAGREGKNGREKREGEIK